MKLPLRTPALLAATVAALAVAIPSTAVAHNRVKEYSLAEFAGVMTLGPDRNLWYASSNEPKVGRVEIDR